MGENIDGLAFTHIFDREILTDGIYTVYVSYGARKY